MSDSEHRDVSKAGEARRLAIFTGVGRRRLLIPFELGPVGVTIVVILQQNRPLLKPLAVAIARSGTTIDDLGALLAFAVSIGARVERGLEHGDHIAVADRRPLKADPLLPV